MEENKQKEVVYDFTELELVIRKWAVLSGFEKDLSNYAKMKEFYA